jgi:hypothetical protein
MDALRLFACRIIPIIAVALNKLTIMLKMLSCAPARGHCEKLHDHSTKAGMLRRAEIWHDIVAV